MNTGDVYLDSMYLYFPSLLSQEHLLRAVKTRFPKQTHLLNLNKDELLNFYLAHIFPRPQRKYPRDAKGMVLRALRSREEKEGKQEEEEKSWLYPRERPKFRHQRFGRRFWHDSLEAEVDKKMKLQAEQIKARQKDLNKDEKLAQPNQSAGNPGPSTSQKVDLKRNSLERHDKEPAKRQRSEITWP